MELHFTSAVMQPVFPPGNDEWMCEIRVGRYSGDERSWKSGSLRTSVSMYWVARVLGKI
jgi:hypothetical protein